ncbi:sirohydrochlorin chelatase [Thiofilum flexile]|uniref:sirohydrochlorin chelatase n=1 Tax=Thiofilum flexile TaxID=125627 RepID=UPI00036272C9|nr:CbiX/SirB N-terminal domain-containing protein [Thiofilum flexile]
MKSLLVVAHGSRKEQSNNEIRQLAQRLQEQSDSFTRVSCAFLELAEPSIPDGIQTCIDQGATEVLVLPYFLSAGRHVSHDVPSLVHQKRLEHPTIAIKMASYLGVAKGLERLILATAEQVQCERCKASIICDYPSCIIAEG